MLVIADQRPFYTEVVEQFYADSGVLSGYEIRLLKGLPHFPDGLEALLW